MLVVTQTFSAWCASIPRDPHCLEHHNIRNMVLKFCTQRCWMMWRRYDFTAITCLPPCNPLTPPDAFVCDKLSRPLLPRIQGWQDELWWYTLRYNFVPCTPVTSACPWRDAGLVGHLPAPSTSTSPRPNAVGNAEEHAAFAGNATVYRGSVALYRPKAGRLACDGSTTGTVPVPGHHAAISGMLSLALDPTCLGTATNCAWCNRDAKVTGPGGSAVFRIVDKVPRFSLLSTCMASVFMHGTALLVVFMHEKGVVGNGSCITVGSAS